MKKLKWLALALSLFAGSAVGGNIPQQVTDYFKHSVWKVNSDVSQGSAFQVEPTFLVTNRHVIEEGENFTIQQNVSVGSHDVEVVAVSDVWDLALLYCATCADTNPVVPIIEDFWFDLGLEVWGGGYGKSILSIHHGYTASFDYYSYKLTTTVYTVPGDSGSPVVTVTDDGRLRLVGVRTQVTTHAIPIAGKKEDNWVLEERFAVAPIWGNSFLEPAGGVAGLLRRRGIT